MRVLAPSSAEELAAMLHDAIHLADDGPVALRWPRGAAHHVREHEVGVGLHARKARSGDGSLAILAIGKLVVEAQQAAEALAVSGIDATVWDVRSCMPLDPEMIADAAAHGAVITAEDGVREGGIGMSIADRVRDVNPTVPVQVLGIPSKFLPQGSADKILGQLGLDADGIVTAAQTLLA
jgi:1-deoxy-D-xylulose-5-phosphate synthase